MDDIQNLFDPKDMNDFEAMLAELEILPSIVDVVPEELELISDEKYKAKYNVVSRIFVKPLLDALESYEKSVNPQNVHSVYGLKNHSIKAQMRLLSRYLKAYGIGTKGLIPSTREDFEAKMRDLYMKSAGSVENNGPMR